MSANPVVRSSAAIPPGSWRPARKLAQVVLAPVQRFLAVEASSGILLLVAAAAALTWANSPCRESYFALWHIPIGFSLGSNVLETDLHHVINDGLMTLFFFVIGLEIRRELYRGQLSVARQAALPLFAALGGMILPAALYAIFNLGWETLVGWGVPMATDIAFALGVLALLGNRVPTSLRVLLLSLAIVDDIGAILVIALFYSPGFDPDGLTICVVGLFMVKVLQIFGVRSAWTYVIPALVIWDGAVQADVHPSLAGVMIGLMTPVQAWIGRVGFLEEVRARVDVLGKAEGEDERDLVPHLQSLEQAGREAISPVERLIHALHGWVAFGILPLFAFANAGVALERVDFLPDSWPVLFGIGAGLLLGKPLGILGLSWLAQKARLAALPPDLTWRHIVLVGILGGIGFTMSIFIADLAFLGGRTLEIAKVAILGSSALAALVGLGFGWFLLERPATEPEPSP